MNVLEAIQTRRAVKSYDPQHRMSEAEIEQLLSLAMLSPTSFNIQNWRFVVVTDSALRKQLRAASWGQAQVEEASLLIILCADLKAWEKHPERYWANAPKAASDTIVPMIGQFYGSREQVQRDEAMRSCGIAAQTIMLAAREMGYDTCPMVGFDAEVVSKLVNLPHDHVISMFVVVGKPLQPANERGGQLAANEVVVMNTFA